jgi:hypothetical protein
MTVTAIPSAAKASAKTLEPAPISGIYYGGKILRRSRPPRAAPPLSRVVPARAASGGRRGIGARSRAPFPGSVAFRAGLIGRPQNGCSRPSGGQAACDLDCLDHSRCDRAGGLESKGSVLHILGIRGYRSREAANSGIHRHFSHEDYLSLPTSFPYRSRLRRGWPCIPQ